MFSKKISFCEINFGCLKCKYCIAQADMVLMAPSHQYIFGVTKINYYDETKIRFSPKLRFKFKFMFAFCHQSTFFSKNKLWSHKKHFNNRSA